MKSMVLGCCMRALATNGMAADQHTLITPEEAALPPAPTASIALLTRGMTRKPEVILVSPKAGVTSPFNLEFKFKAHGGSVIKPDSFHLIYVKNPNVDLTGRVRPFLKANGIDMDGAEAPPGGHTIKATVSDSDNREGTAVFTINVLK